MILILIFVLFSQASCGCGDYLPVESLTNESACTNTKCDPEVIATMVTELGLTPEMCSCKWDETNDECYEDNDKAKSCFEAISERTCNKFEINTGPDTVSSLCKWENGRCRTVCGILNGGAERGGMDNMTLMAQCMTEVGCYFNCAGCSEGGGCDGTCGSCVDGGCNSYTAPVIGNCPLHVGCNRVGDTCVTANCGSLENAELCKNNSQCDWHPGGGKECGPVGSCDDATRTELCVLNAEGQCELKIHCRPKVRGAGGVGNQQCNGYGETECQERLVCTYASGAGCTYKGDRSLVTKVGGMTVMLVSLLLLFMFF